MSELIKRTLTGALYVALTLGAAYAGSWTTLVLFVPVCAIAAREFHRLVADAADPIGERMMMFLCAIVCAAVAVIPMVSAWSIIHVSALAWIILTACMWLVMTSSHPDPARPLGMTALSIVYIAVPFGLLTWLLGLGVHPYVGFMLMLWTNDTGAYLVGRAMGRTKLMPSISPKKTVEGLLGGILFTALMAWLLASVWKELTLAQWLAAAFTVSVFSTAGDLLESAFKRARGVKDSGNLLPGHGGILDRFDGFLLALPAVLLVIMLLR